MSKLYTELAEIYEKMYATFIDYKEEYLFYSRILKKYNKQSVLELGSGTGNLSRYFDENGFEYLGLDLNKEMIEIAKRKNPSCNFMEGDMRNFKLQHPMESIIITGRSISYLLKNEDINSAFKNIHNNLKEGGIFCFDIIDANRFIPEILETKSIIHKASFEGKHYSRESKWSLNLTYGMDLIWDSRYYEESDGEYKEIGKDSEVARPFTKNEIELFLDINDFDILNIIDRATYAFPTFVFVAQKR